MKHLGKAAVDCALYKGKNRYLGDNFRQMSRGQNDKVFCHMQKTGFASQAEISYSPKEAKEENDVFC